MNQNNLELTRRSHWIASLHRSLTGQDLEEQDLREAVRIVSTEDPEKSIFNEYRIIEKLKLHLIYQTRHKDSKRFVEIQQRLKRDFPTVLRRREWIMRLLYETFDKESTRTAFSVAPRSETRSTSSVMPAPVGSNDQKEIRSNAERIGAYAKTISYRNNRASEPAPAAHVEVKKGAMKNGERFVRVESNDQVDQPSRRGHIAPDPNSNSSRCSELNSSTSSSSRPAELSSFVTMRRSGQGISSSTHSSDGYRSIFEASGSGYTTPTKTPILQSTMELDTDFNPMHMPTLNRPEDEEMRVLLHRSTNRVPSLLTSRLNDPSAATIFRSPTAASQQSSIMVFPPDHGRNLLSSRSDNLGGFVQNSARTLNSNSFSFKRGPPAAPVSQSSSSRNMHSSSIRMARSSRSIALNRNAGIQRSLLRDLVYIFQGINGTMIKIVPQNNTYEICSQQPLHPSLRLQALRLCEFGYFFAKIKNFCDKPGSGLMVHGFKHGLDNELQEFYRLLAIIQTQLQVEAVDTPLSEELLAYGEEGEIMTLHKLLVWIFDSGYRLEVLSSMIDACENKTGGELCSVLFRYTEHGDAVVASMTIALLTIVTKPLFLILCQWILYGELEDPHNEFFIASDKDCKKEELWHSKFHIREKMLPSFVNMKGAQKILATGKNINFLKDICHNSKGYECRNDVKLVLESTPVECIFLEDDRVLSNAIDRAYRTTSEMVLKVLIEESRLLDHLRAIKKYLLLGQGDFIQYLLELLQEELSKPVSKLYNHNLTAILESAIRATNAQFEDEDILSRLDTRILPGNDRETGWDVFCLDYKANGPIGTVLTQDVIVRYNQLFNTLWRTKRIESMLSTLWKNQTALFKYQRVMPELGPVLHQSQLLISEMIHFVHQTQYYIMFEVTECAWDKLEEEVKKATDLDQVIKAHDSFLETIQKRALLDLGKRNLLNQLRAIFDTVIQLKEFLTSFDDRVTVEVWTRRDPAYKATPVAEVEARKHFFIEYIAQAKGEIERIYGVTQNLVREFLLLLNRQQDSDSLTLQCLSFRLDFSEYYARRDARVNFPLTYLHRRRSSSAFHHSSSPLFTSMTQSLGASPSQSYESGQLTQSFNGTFNYNEQSSTIPE